MSFVPVSGPAVLRTGTPPREAVVAFTGAGREAGREIDLPVRAALPVLSRAQREADAHPSVALLAAGALLALRVVAAGKIAPSADGSGWAPVLDDAEDDRLTMLARARAYDGVGADDAELVLRDLLAAVVDAVPRGVPVDGRSVLARTGASGRRAGRQAAPDNVVPLRPAFADRLQARIARGRAARARGAVDDGLPHLVGLSLRVEADEEELVAGSVRVVLQVVDEQDPAHVVDAAVLWGEPGEEDGVGPGGHGFGSRATTHALLALRRAAEAWPVLDRLLELRVPDQLTLDGAELADLLEHGVAALRGVGVDVLWPRALGRELTSRTVVELGVPGRAGQPGRPAEPGMGGVREEPLVEGLFGTEAVFSFRWQLALHDDPLTPEEMDALAQATSPVIRLRDNWLVVDPAVARRAGKRLVRTVTPVQALAAALTGSAGVVGGPGSAGALGSSAAPDEGDVSEHVVVGATLAKVRDRLDEATTREPVPVPAGLRAELRTYQRQGLTWLAEMTGLGLGACLADDMGLGKTVTLIALHLHRAPDSSAARASRSAAAVSGAPGAPGVSGPTLVVCPTSLLGNWEAEIRRFAPGVPVRRFHGSSRTLPADPSLLDADPSVVNTDPSLLDADPSVVNTDPSVVDADPSLLDADRSLLDAGPGFVLTTYGTLRRDLARGREASALARVGWGMVVADEAQHVKNPASATARALRAVCAEPPPGRTPAARVALTGTPVENDLTELWAILDWCTPGLLGSRNAFRKVWAGPIESGLEPTKAKQFADLVRPFLLRRRKSDPGIAPELPPKTETDHVLDLTREQVVLYETLVRESMRKIEEATEEVRRGLVLAMLTGLKQICNHPAQYLRSSVPVRSLRGSRSAKLDLLDEVVATVRAEGGAVLVFTQYVAMGHLLSAHLDATGVPHQFLHGGTPVREREAMVARFQDGEVPVFLLSLKAGGTGLNLTRADHVVHVDRWWNPAVEEQATDRAYRIGQTRPVQVHRLVMRGTIEERVAELLARKRALADAVLAGGDAALTELSNAELHDLVALRRERDARDER